MGLIYPYHNNRKQYTGGRRACILESKRLNSGPKKIRSFIWGSSFWNKQYLNEPCLHAMPVRPVVDSQGAEYAPTIETERPLVEAGLWSLS